MEHFKTWEEMSSKEQLVSLFCDAYKDAHGFRPRHIRFDLCTEQDLERELDQLQLIIEDNEGGLAAAERAAAHDFELRVQNLMHSGAKSREMALRWIHEAEGSNGDGEYLCFLLGMPHNYLKVDKAPA